MRRRSKLTLVRCVYRAAQPDHPRQCAGERVPGIAAYVGCDEQTVRNAIIAFNAQGTTALAMGSRRPKSSAAIFTAERAEQLKHLLHRQRYLSSAYGRC